jgi:hypothetical protein
VDGGLISYLKLFAHFVQLKCRHIFLLYQFLHGTLILFAKFYDKLVGMGIRLL